MLGQRLRAGMRLKLAGQEYSLEQRLPDGNLQMKHKVTLTRSSCVLSFTVLGERQLNRNSGVHDFLSRRSENRFRQCGMHAFYAVDNFRYVQIHSSTGEHVSVIS